MQNADSPKMCEVLLLWIVVFINFFFPNICFILFSRRRAANTSTKERGNARPLLGLVQMVLKLGRFYPTSLFVSVQE